MPNDKDFKVKKGVKPTVYHEKLGTVVSGADYYSLSSASYDNVNFSVASQESSPVNSTFSSDGTKMYVIGTSAANSVFQYNLSTPWDLSTASYASKSFNYSSQIPNGYCYGIGFSSDSTKMYLVNLVSRVIQQYSLSTAGDVSTATYDSVSLNVSSQTTSPFGIFFKPDGSQFYLADVGSDRIVQYTLSTPWSLSSASYTANFSVSSQDGNMRGVYLTSSGTNMFTLGSDNSSVYSYTLSTAWSVASATYDSLSFSTATQETDIRSLFFSASGNKMFILGYDPYRVYQYSTTLNTRTLDLSTGSVFQLAPTSNIQLSLSNPADSGTVSGATLLLEGAATSTYNFSALSNDSKSYTATFGPNSISFKPDGTKMFLMSNGAIANQYSLTNPNDITTTSYDSVSFNFSSQDAGMSGLFFKSDGTKMYAVGSVTDNVYQYSLSTPWNLSTASYDSVSFSIAAQDAIPYRLFFKPDGTKMYVDGRNGYRLFQYSLSTPWSLSTASYDSVSYLYNTTLSYDLGQFFFTSDGTKIYFISGAAPSSVANEEVVGVSTLSTPWNITTIGARSTFNISSLDSTPYGIQFSVDGVKLFVSGDQNDKVYQLNSSIGPTITYDSSIDFPGGTAPTSPAIGDTDVLVFTTRDGGTSYKAALAIDGAV